MDESQNNNGTTRPWWRDGVALASQVSGWIIGPLVAALYGGQYLDERYGTTNVFFLSTTGIAFIISCIGIARIGSTYIQSISNVSSNTQKKDKDNESDRPTV